MKKVIMLAVLVFGGAVATQATLLFEEHFNSAAGDLNGTTPTLGGAWYANSGSGSTPAQIAAGGLTAPSGFAASSGNMAKTAISSGLESHATFATQTTGTTVYYSFLLNIPTLETQAGSNLIGLSSTDGADYASVRYVRNSADDFYTLGLSYRNTTGFVMDTTHLAAGSTHLLVLSYQIISGTLNDVASFWLDPSSSTFGSGTAPTALLTLTGSSTDTTSLNTVEIKNGSIVPTPTYIDEIRVGTSWADVTPIPEPATVGMLGVGAAVAMLLRRIRK